MEDKHEEPMRGCGIWWCLQEWQQEAPGIKGSPCLKREYLFLFLTTTMPPKLTPLFHPESDEEADKAIQEAEDAKVHSHA